ncbi:MAG TPA: FAD-binding oxidoreductase [Aestuariivirga sp.]|nr:FAD-binding oxidoreductase [Aestuariivirga sp.]
MAAESSLSQSVTDLAKTFGGQLLQPADAGYEEARKVHNGLVNKRPALIARCKGTADIVDAVNLARKLGLEIAVRGGGHNVAGRATVDDGLMIDLAPMKGIHVDAKSRTARAQGGVTWAEFNRETQLHGLATTGGVVSTTGIAGLTLGGGLGWLMPKYGMALDNLLSAEVVTAEGKVVRASKEENADLFWALRGGGGNFGVVTSFEFRLHPVGPVIYGGLAAHPFDKARDVLRFYRDATASLADEVMAFCGLVHAPDGSGAKLAALVVAHCGDIKAGEAALKPFKSFGPPVMDAVGPIPYSALNGMLDAGFPKGALNYWKSSFLSTLSDAAIDAMIGCFAKCPTPMGAMLLEHFHGAACRVAADATAFPHREESYNLAVLGEWMDPKQTDACVAWTRETYDAIKPFMAARRYVNYLGDDETGDVGAAAYGANHARLRKLKAKYDPGNVFHLNQNVAPAR